jgi:hypothetical protein
MSVIGPGSVETELFGHQRSEIQDCYDDFFAGVEKRPRRVAVNEVLVRPTVQA